jgi:hypothetical protein
MKTTESLYKLFPDIVIGRDVKSMIMAGVILSSRTSNL